MRKKELKKLIDEVFKFYGRRALIEDDFYGFFLKGVLVRMKLRICG